MKGFQVKRLDKNDVSVLYPAGFLDAHTVPQFESALSELVENGRYKIVVNFKDLDYISSAGLGVFMGFIEEVRNNGGDIKLCNFLIACTKYSICWAFQLFSKFTIRKQKHWKNFKFGNFYSIITKLNI